MLKKSSNIAFGVIALIIAVPVVTRFVQKHYLEPHQYDTYTLRSGDLSIKVKPNIPLIVESKYDQMLWNSPVTDTPFYINGVPAIPSYVGFQTVSAQYAFWKMDFADSNLSMRIGLRLDDHSCLWEVEEINDPQQQLFSLELKHTPISLTLNPGMSLDVAAMQLKNVGQNCDSFFTLTAQNIIDTELPYTYLFLNSENCAVTLDNNCMDDHARVYLSNAGIRPGMWQWRKPELPQETTEKPYFRLIFAKDINHDGKVNWQDAANRYRDYAYQPFGGKDIKYMVAPQIAMNFASQAQTPFWRTLDAVKQVYLFTDGLGQSIQFKGFQTEGHDSSHPEYSEVGQRQGGKQALNAVLARFRDYATTGGIHINATESYPESRAYDASIVKSKDWAWVWLDVSEKLDLTRDITTGSLYRRLDEMNSAFPNLGWVYLDVYFGQKWEAWKMGKKFETMQIPLYTEYAQVLERFIVWAHWSLEYVNKGQNSQITRLIWNDQKDVWSPHPLLGGAQLAGFMGWGNKGNTLTTYVQNVFEANLPTKFLQQSPIIAWQDSKIIFANGTRAESDKYGITRIYKDQLLVGTFHWNRGYMHQRCADEMTYLIPWQDSLKLKMGKDDTLIESHYNQEKFYHYSTKGGVSLWEISPEYAGKALYLYELSAQGRTQMKMVQVDTMCHIQISAKPKTPYVLTLTPQESPAMCWGEGTHLEDPNFCGDVKTWNPFGKSIVYHEGKLVFNETGSVFAPVMNLEPGKRYSANVLTTNHGTRPTILRVASAQKTLGENKLTSSQKVDGYPTLRQRVEFVAPLDSEPVRISLRVEEGTDSVSFQQVRIVEIGKMTLNENGFFEDFDDVDFGWGPFMYVNKKGSMHIHLSEAHPPYTRDVISGKYSLKSLESNVGEIYRTAPGIFAIQQEGLYEIKFDYITEKENDYALEIFDGMKRLDPKMLSQTQGVGSFSMRVKLHPNAYISFVKKQKGRTVFVIDNISVQRVSP